MSLSDYRFIGEEMESLGRRLDSARGALKRSKSQWSQTYWQTVIDQLLFHWRCLPILHDGQVTGSEIRSYNIGYDFFEGDDGIGKLDTVGNLLKKYSLDRELDISWDRAIQKRLLKAY